MFLLSTNVKQEEHAQENDFLQWLGIFHPPAILLQTTLVNGFLYIHINTSDDE